MVVYGFNPRVPLDLSLVPDLKMASAKAEDFVSQLHLIHESTQKHIEALSRKYKNMVDQRRRVVEFEVGDLVYAVLTKERFLVGEYNKLKARKIGPFPIG